MFAIKSDLVLFLVFFRVSYCERRIQDGSVVKTDKSYVVYLVKAPIALRKYDFWTCGGALVSSEFVLTSAACVDDVNYLYVVAGYKKYVTDREIEYDPCTKEMKKKVIYTCIPDGYDVKYDQLEKWSLIDIALVKVESPFDLTDTKFNKICSYIPTTIPINYEARYQDTGTDAIVLGWGHLYKWRIESDTKNYNQNELSYAPVLIMDKDLCKTHYEVYTNMSEVIDKYMICSYEEGNINDSGEPIEKSPAQQNHCKTQDWLRTEAECERGDEDFSDPDSIDNTRRDVRNSNQTYKASMIDVINRTVTSEKRRVSNKTAAYKTTSVSNGTIKRYRRSGICQNDHGGPLVTWVGTHEVVIGVASVFKVNEDSECIGPYLYTSTQCNGAFINCVLTHDDWPQKRNNTYNNISRRGMCKKEPNDKGHATLERHISWLYHPNGPADNEKHETRGRSGTNEREPDKKNANNKKNTANENVAANQQHVLNENYAANERYTTNNKMYAANEKYIADGKYGAREKYTADSNYAANQRYPANGKYTANERYSAGGKYAANERYPDGGGYAANHKYTADDKYGPNEKYAAIDKYSLNKKYAVNDKYVPIPSEKLTPNVKYVANDKFAINDSYTGNERLENFGNVDNDKLIMRPQIPLRG